MADDADFPFTFGDVSDGEEVEGLFVDKKAAKKRAALKANEEPYQAQIESDGWLLHCLESPEEVMYEKNGANKAYRVATVYCQVVRDNNAGTVSNHNDRSFKVTDCRDLEEMRARAALKLGKAEEAAQIVDNMTSPDAGFVFLKATVYKAAGRYNGKESFLYLAIKCLVDFQRTRSSNYAIWRQIAECLYPYLDEHDPSVSTTTASDDLKSALALISISRSRFLMEAASWPESGFGHARYVRELTHIKNLQSRIEKSALNIDPQLKEIDKDAYDQKVEALVETWRSLPSSEEQGNVLGTLDRSVVDYIWETWVQTLKGDGSGAVLEHRDDKEVVKAVRDM
ncbi:hypothetical protein BGW42_004852 [Actinomortierella wolfii]|nr:hypothetical protein BGW42_004852 [Actinomortierella wolfii]